MKPSASTSTTTKSASSSPSTSKSRIKKSSSSSSSSSSVHSSGSLTPQQTPSAQANSNHSNRSGNEHASTSSSSNRDKNSQKSYTGINGASVKCIWDQIDTNEISINADILPIIAEDASYKLWELINNVKIFSRHSGGKVTTDIVNEVLKNCSTAPIVGASATHHDWQRFEYDGKFYSPSDRILDLRQEYLKSSTMQQCGPITVDASWITNPRNDKDLTKLWRSIILAIILGDDAAYQYTIHTTLINPFIGVILPELVQKTIEYLVFGCTDDTLDRLLGFLKVLVQNYHARDVSNNEEYFNLCNLFLCLLLGTIDMKAKLDWIKCERQKLKQQQAKEQRETKTVSETIIKTIKNEQQQQPQNKPQQHQQKQKQQITINTKPTATATASATVPVAATPTTTNTTSLSKDLYGNFVVNPIALNIKTETPDVPDERDDQRFFDFGTESKYDGNLFNMGYQDDDIIFDINTNQGIHHPDGSVHQYDNASKMNSKPTRLTCDDVFSPFITDPCDDRFVDDVCLLIGYLSGRLGYFEHEITYLLSKRLEIFFFEDRNTWTVHDFQWLRRIIQALTYLGETAFRELSLYFEHIPNDEFPEWLIPYFGYGAIYIRGRRDVFFYEYMQAVCGDVLVPFLVKLGANLNKLNDIWTAYCRKHQKNEWRINRKHTIRFSQRTQQITTTTKKKPPTQLKEMFPHSGPPIKKSTKLFVFDVGIQIFPKPTIRLTADQKFIQSFDLCNKLNKLVVRYRRIGKLVRINNRPIPKQFVDFRLYNL